MSTPLQIDRRDFLRGLLAGSSFVVAAQVSTQRLWAQGDPEPTDWTPDIFVSLDEKATLTIYTHRSEMGTGIRSTLPVVLADEVDADLDRIHIVQAIGDARYGSQNTDGSRSIVQFYDTMRLVGARLRYYLEHAAAEHWSVDASECRLQRHTVRHSDGRSLDFADVLAPARAVQERLDAQAQAEADEKGRKRVRPKPSRKELRFKEPEEQNYVGKHIPSIDLRNLTTGAGQFAADVTPEGCLYAVIARAPVLGAVAKSVDDSAALAIPGVQKVHRMEAASAPFMFKALGGVAVIASNTSAALRGRDALKIEWDLEPAGANAQYDSDAYRQQLEANVLAEGAVAKKSGDVDAGFSAAAQTHEASYYLPHLAHAPMEPPACVAIAKPDGCELWACVQNPQAAQAEVAQALGLDPEKVICNVTLLGGGFGRKSKPDFCAEAALLSRDLKAPVKVFWTREDDLRHDYYHACSALYLKAGLSEDGSLTAWLGRSACNPIGSTWSVEQTRGGPQLSMGFNAIPYQVENFRTESCEAPAHVRIGWLRSVGHVFHAFGVCSFADELALLQDQDPVDYLTGLIGDEEDRLLRVARHCRDQSNYGEKLPAGQAHGFAMHSSFGSHVAVIAQVAVSSKGVVSYPRIDMAIDCGRAINPDRVIAQMEGSVIFGISLLHSGAITAKEGAVVQGNFDTYPVARIADTPKAIHVHILNSGQDLGGVGEPGVPPVAPAICNAIARVTGKRVRSLPLRDHDLSWS